MPRLGYSAKLYRFLLLLTFAAVLSFSENVRSISAQSTEEIGAVVLRLRAVEFDPVNDLQPDPDQSPLASPGDEADQSRLWIIQFAGPIQDRWVETTSNSSLEILTYIPNYAYLVWGNAAAVEQLSLQTPLRWWGEYLPVFALHPDLSTAAFPNQEDAPPFEKPEPIRVDVQLANQPELAPVVMDIIRTADWVVKFPHAVLEFQNLTIAIAPDKLGWLAKQPGIVDVSPHYEMKLLDEVQGQILAGNLDASGNGLAGPGYLNWLIDQGFVNDPELYPIVDVTDDGIDDGDDGVDDCIPPVTECDDGPAHRDFYLSGNRALADRLVYNRNLTNDSSADGRGGHGTLNASVVAGYNQGAGLVNQDPNGYQRGLGINPFGRLGGSKVFENLGNWGLNGTYADLIRGSYLRGARISSNSWGASTFGSYTLDDQQYDALVRDAVSDQAGNQEMTIVFAAGNDGSGGNTIGSPGNAKNVITVGASETYRPAFEIFSVDHCLNSVTDADNLEQIADFSSRGPTDDGRVKPELVAPGTMILGAASQAPGYLGDGVCMPYYPSGQTFYAASSGTSHSTPAIAGAASLLDHFYRERFGGANPSPAMLKAYLVNSARYLTDRGEFLPSNHQGFGRVDLGRAFDETPRWVFDQGLILDTTGDLYEVPGMIFNPQTGLRVTLAWTDAPGAPMSGAAAVNNLDLEVEHNGQTYRGNVFSGAFSQTGGSPDYRNNVESIVLPSGGSGAFTIRVRATNIAGDGIPGNPDLTDQDFALVVYNAVTQAGIVRGQVNSTENGEPVADALVWAVSADNRRVQTTTDTGGNYELALFAGRYSLNVWKQGFSQSSIDDVLVDNGVELTRDFAISPEAIYRLSGCIRDQATIMGLAAGIEFFGPLDTLVGTAATTRAEPCFQVDLPAGSYTVRAFARLHNSETAGVTLDNDRTIDFNLSAVTLEGLIIGQVLDHMSGSPIADALVTVVETGDEYRTAGDGRFEFQLPADSYHVSATVRFYQDETVSVEVPQSNIEEHDIELRSARMLINSPIIGTPQISASEAIGLNITLENRGEAPLVFEVYERQRLLSTGGEDSAGYSWTDNQISSEVLYEWPEQANKTILALSDDQAVEIELPFPFPFYEETYSSLLVGNNGAAAFNPELGVISYQNPRLSDVQQPLLAPFWDDLDDERGDVSYWTAGTEPNRKFILAWRLRPHYNNLGEISFAIVLYETTGNIKFLYEDVIFGSSEFDRGESATVGIRGAGPAFLEYSYNQASLSNGRAICFQPSGSPPCDRIDLPWLKTVPERGDIEPGESTMLSVTFQAWPGTPFGYLVGGIQIYSNDPLEQPFVDLPLQAYFAPPPIYLPFIRR